MSYLINDDGICGVFFTRDLPWAQMKREMFRGRCLENRPVNAVCTYFNFLWRKEQTKIRRSMFEEITQTMLVSPNLQPPLEHWMFYPVYPAAHRNQWNPVDGYPDGENAAYQMPDDEPGSRRQVDYGTPRRSRPTLLSSAAYVHGSRHPADFSNATPVGNDDSSFEPPHLHDLRQVHQSSGNILLGFLLDDLDDHMAAHGGATPAASSSSQSSFQNPDAAYGPHHQGRRVRSIQGGRPASRITGGRARYVQKTYIQAWLIAAGSTM